MKEDNCEIFQGEPGRGLGSLSCSVIRVVESEVKGPIPTPSFQKFPTPIFPTLLTPTL